jgi:3-carboxy-cis,cis-muconate cycloisomerase
MAVSPFESAWAGGHLGDAETAALFSDTAEIAAMVQVEAALARVQGRLGVIPAAAGEAIAGALDGVVVDPAALGPGTAGAGIPVPALVEALRRIVGGEAAHCLHWGATSQDIVDTGWCCGSARSRTCSAAASRRSSRRWPTKRGRIASS